MGCIAQVLQKPAKGRIIKPSHDCCNCDNIITKVDPVYVLMKQINVTILRGYVCCGETPDDCSYTNRPCTNPVEGAVVVATVTVIDTNFATVTENYYVGITNDKGEYSICVPVPEGKETVTYEVQAYKCSCTEDLSDDVPCNCDCDREE